MNDWTSTGRREIELRRLPYPYEAMLAICSDLDETPDRHVYRESMRFLNTTENTVMGEGVGLEIGNTMYFDMPPDQFAYWNTDEAGREMVRNLIRSGHIDCIHSFGDLATTRRHAEVALEELTRHGCKMKVWIDHGTAVSNLDGGIMLGEGDLPESPAYHADLTCAYGVEYVWRGRVTSVIGQDVPRRLGGLWTPRHPVASARTVLKEGIKGILAAMGNPKYSIHGPNRILRHTELRDGQPVWEFLRANTHWGGVSSSETADGLADVLTKDMLSLLMEREGFCVLYTHLGKIRDRQQPFGQATREALRHLSNLAQDGRVLVTTTRRLLDYCRMTREVDVSIETGNGERHIVVSGNVSDGSADGLTFYVDNPAGVRLFIGDQEFKEPCRNGPDHRGMTSISVPWKRLDFPVLT